MIEVTRMRRVVIWLCLAGLLLVSSNADLVRSKRDDADAITVTTIEEKPYLHKEGDKFVGFIPDMMEKVKNIVRIGYKFELVPDQKYGQKGSDDTWNGMIGEIQNKKADMAAAPMTISKDREEVVDFTTPYMTFDITVLVKKPSDGSKLSIKSVRDLADQTTIKYGLLKDGHTEAIFKTAKDGDKFKDMWEEIRNGNRLGSNEEGVTKVRNGNGTFAFIMERVSAEYWILKKPCELTTTPEDDKAKKSSYAFALKKGWNRKKDFDAAIQKLKDNGEIAKLKKKWWNGFCGAANGASVSKAVSFPSVTLLAFVSALYLYHS